MQIEGNRLLFFKDLYDTAKDLQNTNLANLDRHYAQYKGSNEIDGGDNATVVRNITYELIESQVTSYIPTPAVNPKRFTDKNERNAKSIETLLRNLRDNLPFEKMNDMDERYNPIYGGSVWLVEWDESIMTHNTIGDVVVSCLSPKRFVGQPNIYEIADMEYCFVDFETTKEDVERKYDVKLTDNDDIEQESGGDDKTTTITVCYYKDDNDNVCKYVWSGETELQNISNYYARKRKICKICGKREGLCNCENPQFETQSADEEELTQDIQLSDGSVIPSMVEKYNDDGTIAMETVEIPLYESDGSPAYDMSSGIPLPMTQTIQRPMLEPTRIPFYKPNILPVVIRKNTSEEDNLFGQSDCEFIRPQQQAINKLESRIQEKLLQSGVFPIVPETFTGDLDNSVFKKAFRATQETISLFGRVDLQVDIARDIAQADRLYDQAKRILGISDTFMGQSDTTAKSGYAKQLQIQQASGRLDSKRQMKNAAYAEIDKIIFQYYLAYADEPRAATYKDAQGRTQNVIFNRYDFIERDESGEFYYEDQFLFSTDATIDVEKSRETLWQENRQNFQSGAYGNPELTETQLIFWQNMEKAHYPWAQDNVERLKEQLEQAQQMQMIAAENEQLKQAVNTKSGYINYLQNELQKRGTAIG